MGQARNFKGAGVGASQPHPEEKKLWCFYDTVVDKGLGLAQSAGHKHKQSTANLKRKYVDGTKNFRWKIMNELTQQQEFKLAIVGLAEYYGTGMTENRLKMFYEDLSVLNFDELKKAIMLYRQNPEFKFMPLPAQLIAIIRPHVDPIDDARDVANLILDAVSRFGWTNPESARNHIGQLGWEVVNRMGTWQHLCETLSNDNEGMYRAQIRDYAQTVQKKAMRGELHQKPQLVPSEGFATIGDVAKNLLERK